MVIRGKKYKPKWRNITIILIMLIFFSGIIYSSINLIGWSIDYKNNQKQVEELQKNTKIEEKEDNENTNIIEQEEIPEDNPYWDYIKMNMIDVDFTDLKNTNSDVKGWVKVNGTNINYPFVQASDNKYYLTHSFNKEYNRDGWVFLDYRNNGIANDRNTIIYGHTVSSNAMFTTLQNIIKPEWQDDASNHIVRISTETENTLWQVFSVYTIPTTSDYIQVSFSSDKEFSRLVNRIKNRSLYDFATEVSDSDKILTLSSCYINSNNKVVLHAKLIKIENK